MLAMVRLRLATLHALAGDWQRLRPLLSTDDQLDELRQLHAMLAPRLQHHLDVASSPRKLRLALTEMCDSLRHFNRRWGKFLNELDLSGINTLREGYNRYYVLEKECAVRSPRVARQGFQPLELLTAEHILNVLPTLANALCAGPVEAPRLAWQVRRE
jgi:hypothetical protein